MEHERRFRHLGLGGSNGAIGPLPATGLRQECAENRHPSSSPLGSRGPSLDVAVSLDARVLNLMSYRVRLCCSARLA